MLRVENNLDQNMEQKKIKNSLINYINKKGKKVKSEKIYNKLLISLKKKVENDPKVIMEKVIENLSPKMSIKSLKKGRTLAYYLKEKNQINMSIKWLCITNNIKSKDLLKNLIKEISNTFNNKSDSLSKKKELYDSLKRARIYVRKSNKRK